MSGLAYFQSSQTYDADLPLSTLPPKGESPECYKLTGREHYKVTNSKLPKENTPSEQGTELGGSGGHLTGKGCDATLTFFVPRASH